jgi:hypothetical protein
MYSFAQHRFIERHANEERLALVGYQRKLPGLLPMYTSLMSDFG